MGYAVVSNGRGGVKHIRSYTMDKCPTLNSGHSSNMTASAWEETPEAILAAAGRYSARICKNCHRNILEIINGTPAASCDNGERDMPSLEEIAAETPLPTPADIRAILSGEQAKAPAVPVHNREAWLLEAVREITAVFEENGYTVPPVRISVGWPGGKGKKTMLKTIGQCWYGHQSSDGLAQIFISPALTDTVEIMATIAHEMVHAVAGGKCGHRGLFRTIALQIGLEGKMTATNAGDALKGRFVPMLERLGTYDHAKLNVSLVTAPANKNRHLKINCHYCEFTARTTRKQMDEHAMPEHCGAAMYED